MPNTLPMCASAWGFFKKDWGLVRSPQLSPQVEQLWVHSLMALHAPLLLVWA
jgi:hypothetical protein